MPTCAKPKQENENDAIGFLIAARHLQNVSKRQNFFSCAPKDGRQLSTKGI
jgi:hypothetical protein